MAFETRQYLILNTDEINLIDFEQVLETSADTVRTSVDGTKTFVKWDGLEPDFTDMLTTKQGPYTHSEILEILTSEEWRENEETE